MPFKLGDKDIQATFRIPFNGVSKGWNSSSLRRVTSVDGRH